MIYSLITNHSPEEINLYVLDYGSGTMMNFKNVPHVGDVVLSTDEDKVKNLFKILEDEIEKRKQLFVNYNGDYATFIKRSEQKLPYILVFINYFDTFSELYDLDETLNKLSRESAKYGIILIASVNTTGGMRYKLRQNFHSNLTLQFNDQDDYSVVIGNTHKLFPSEVYGRGLVKLDNIYEFQTARIANDEELLDKINNLSDELNKKYSVHVPRIPVVPKEIYINDIISELNGMKRVPVGINKDTIAPELFNFKDSYITLISSNSLDSQSSFIKSLSTIFTKVPNNNVILFDVDELVSDVNSNVLYVNNNYDDTIKKLCDTMEYQYNEYVNNGYNAKTLVNNRNTAVIFYNFSKLLLKITSDNKTRLLKLIENVKNIGKFDFIIADLPNALKSYEYDSWYKNCIPSDYGIWIGNGVADQTLIKTNIGFRKSNNEVPAGYGIVVKNSKIYLVNLVIDKEEDDVL